MYISIPLKRKIVLHKFDLLETKIKWKFAIPLGVSVGESVVNNMRA